MFSNILSCVTCALLLYMIKVWSLKVDLVIQCTDFSITNFQLSHFLVIQEIFLILFVIHLLISDVTVKTTGCQSCWSTEGLSSS